MRIALLPLALVLAAPLSAQPAALPAQPAPVAADGEPSFVRLADLATRAGVVAAVEIRRAVRLKGADAAGVAPGSTRFYVQARVETLLQGAGGLPAEVSYLADVPLDARGRAPKLKAMRVLVLADRVPDRPAELRLVAPDAQFDRTPATERRLRSLLTELVAPDAPAAITGIANAFHVPGSLPGERETQIFLTTASGRPVSLNVLRRPGETPRWAVALGEMVDEAAAPPARDTLLWYRLACTLPAALPAASTADLSETDAAAAQADYHLVVQGLGACTRNFQPD